MKNITQLAVACLAMAILSLVGCGGTAYDLAPVSGKVTTKDKSQPIAGLQLMFNPQPNEANTDPGPWSKGVTDENGEFTLETRYGKKGAPVGKHWVYFEYVDGGAAELDELNEDLDDALEDEDGDKEEVAALKKKIADIEKNSKTRPQIGAEFQLEFEVPAGGTTAADFDFK